MANFPNVLVDYAMSADGHGLVGLCSKIKLPMLKRVTESLLAGGMAAEINIDMATVEAMQLKVTLLEPNAQIIKLFGLGNGNEKSYVFRSALKGKGAAQRFVVKCKGTINELDISDIERKKPAEMEITIDVNQLAMYRNNEELINIDAEAGINTVGGVNTRADINAALGI